MAKDYPRWMYGPNDQSRIFQKDDQIPTGWQDHPDKVKKQSRAKDPAKGTAGNGNPEPTEEERMDTIRQLREAGADISDNATVDEINAAIDKMTAGKQE